MTLEFGSDAWADDVFSSPPVRRVEGRRKWTQRSAPLYDGTRHYTEGLEILATYAFEYFLKLGVITNWKLQPYYWFGKRVPDALLRLAGDGKLAIAQVKSAKYLTADVQAAFDQEAAEARGYGMSHLVWTDQKPLTSGMRDTLLQLRRARNVPVDPACYEAFLDFVRQEKEVTALQIAKAGHHPSMIPVAVRNIDLFIDITEKINERTIVSSHQKFDGRRLLLGFGFDAKAWWNSLPPR